MSIKEKVSERKENSYRIYEGIVTDADDLHFIIGHLPRFFETAEDNGKTLIIEVWLDEKAS